MNRKDKDQPVYLISVVSELLQVHPQTLRLYEREGFVTPKRTKKQRLYSERDLEQLHFILQLTRELGVNRAGVDIILRMRRKMDLLMQEMERAADRMEEDLRKDTRDRLRKMLREE